MSLTYGFFNSVNGDRKYNAEQMSEYFRGIINEGVYQNLDGGLAVTAGTGLAVSVASGRAIVQNRWVQNSESLSLTISSPSEVYARKDAVVIRLNWSSRLISIAVKTGTPAASPVAPSMTRDSATYEMALAYVNVAANATSVTVTDKRSDSTVCGWVTVAQSTSGEVDAQLNAMKTGFDGVVYDSPEEMVTTADASLYDAVMSGKYPLSFNWESGSLDGTGAKLSSTTRIRTILPRTIDGEIIKLSVSAGKKYMVYYYSSNVISASTFIGRYSSWLTDGIEIMVNPDYYYEFLLANSDDSAISQTAGSALSVVEITTTESKINDLEFNQKTIGINTLKISESSWAFGGINPNGSNSSASSTRIRTTTPVKYACVGCKPGYKFLITCYRQDGTARTVDYFKPNVRGFVSSDPWITGEVNLTEFLYEFGETDYFRFALAKADDSDISVAESINFYYKPDNYVLDGTFEKQNKAPSSMLTGERFSQIMDNVSVEFGDLNTSTGEYVASSTKAVSGYIPVKVGTTIKSTYYMDVFSYDNVKTFKYRSYNKEQPPQYLTEWTSVADGFVRIVFVGGHYGTAGTVDITEEDIPEIPNSVLISGMTTINQKTYANSILKIRAEDGLSQLADVLEAAEIDPYKDTYLKRGKIHKSGNQILDAQNSPIVLSGFGTHFMNEYQNLYTTDVFKTLVYRGCNCIRMTFYLNDFIPSGSNRRNGHGWLNHSDELKAIADKLIKNATNQGLYIIIDWHTLLTDGDVTQYASQQLAFFKYFADTYLSTHDNLLWELQNEPWSNSSSEMLSTNKACADYIRGIDPSAIIICGVGTDGASAMNTLYNTTNNMDVFISRHIYTAENTVEEFILPIINAGIPFFETEWGNSEGTGYGDYDDEEAQLMFDTLNEHGISYCLWKLCYQDLTTAILTHDPIRIEYGYRYGGWHDSDLTHNGKFYFKNITKERFDI